VGLATNIPTHNLGEAIDAVMAQIDNPEITIEQLMEKLPGPDFPTGGYIVGSEGIRQAYETGKGKVVIRAKTEIEKVSGGKQSIVITELPFQVNKAKLLEAILEIQEAQKGILGGINDIRDESDRNGMRAVIEIKKDADPEKILEYLYKYSDLQINYNVNMVAIAEGRPMLLNLKQINEHFIRHQQDVVLRRTRYDLERAEEREHILEGLLIAIRNIDEVIRIIKTSKSVPDAKANLMKAFDLTGVQAQAILDMRLARLTALEVEKLEDELREVRKLIKELKAILNSHKKLMEVIKNELQEIRRNYADDRRSEIIEAEAMKEFRPEDYVIVEDTVVVATRDGYVKRMQPNAYQRSNRATPPDNMNGDAVLYCLTGTTALRCFIFSDTGNMFQLSTSELPDARWRDKGVHLSSLINGYGKGEKIAYMLMGEKLPDAGQMIFFTEGGMAKKTEISEYETRNRKIAACGLKTGDRIVSAELCTDETQCVLVTASALGISFKVSEVETMGRATKGVKAIALNPGDTVIAAFLIRQDSELFLLTDRGYGKRELALAIPVQARAGKGGKVFAFAKNNSNGSYIKAAFRVDQPIDLVISQKSGMDTPINTANIALEGMNTVGKLITLVMLDDEITKVFKVQ
jgi:DNA gyrase subunit A